MTNQPKRSRKQKPTNAILTLIAALIAVLIPLLPMRASAQGSQFKIGVLPFADNTGSNSGDVAGDVSRAVQAEIAHSTQLMGVVLTLDSEIGRAHV